PKPLYDTGNDEYVIVKGKKLIRTTRLLQIEGAMTGKEYVDKWYSERGTMGHLMMQYFDLGVLNEEKLDPRMVGFLASWKTFKEQSKIYYFAENIEVQMIDTVYGYCGTIDRLPLLRIKLGAPKKADEFQIGAYYGLCAANKIESDLYLGAD